MSDEILQILKSQSEKIDFIAKKASAHDEQLDFIAKKVTDHEEQLDLIAKKTFEHDEQINRIATKVVERDEQFRSIKETMATKDDIRGITTTLDTIVGLIQKKDQELVMMSHGIQRHEGRIEKLETDMVQVKPALGLI